MPFAENQVRLLAGKLAERHVKTRELDGATLSYIEGWQVIAEANRIFGFDGWDRETVWAERIWEDSRREPKACAYAVRVRIRVRAGDTIVCRDGSGVGQGNGATLGEAHERALKEAETDATKRALTTFGNLFGLALYDKDQAGVRRTKPTTSEPETPWRLVSAGGDTLGVFATAAEFCRALRKCLDSVSGHEALETLWMFNAPSLLRLRSEVPELRTARGSHYADVLLKHYDRRRQELDAGGRGATAASGSENHDAVALNGAVLVPAAQITPGPENDGVVPVNKSVLALGAPKRIRGRDHLAHVASLPCLVCGRAPAQAHHLLFAQPRSMSSKVSDEWTVPLCHLHHRALHDVGDEESWWGEKGIDAKAEAAKLWQERRGDVDRVSSSARIEPTAGTEVYRPLAAE